MIPPRGIPPTQHPGQDAEQDVIHSSIELAKRIEEAECALVAGSAADRAVNSPGEITSAEGLAGGVAVYAGDHSPLTKVAGLGFGGFPDEGTLGRIEARFTELGSPVVVELSTLADPEMGSFLTARGYALCGFENVLGLVPADEPGVSAAGVVVEEIGDERSAEWIGTVATGFTTPDGQGVASAQEFPRELIERAMADMAGLDGFTRYLATVDGAVAGGASMRTHRGIANLCGAATLPPYRRRGVQAALLRRRLADAAACDLAVITTQPGSQSQQNAQRRGFELLYARAILVREPGAGG